MASYTRGHNLLKVAALAIFAFISFSGLFLYMTNRGLAIRQSDIFVRLHSAEGLRKHDKIFFRGVEVGEVRNLQFDAQGDVLIRAHLMERLPLTVDTRADLVAIDLFGRQSLVLKEGDRNAARLLDRDTIAGAPPSTLMSQAESIGSNAERLTGDTTQRLLHAALEGAADATHGVMQLEAEVRALISAQRSSLTSASSSAARLTRNLELATNPDALIAMRETFSQAGLSMAHIAANIDTTSTSLAVIASSLRNGDGTAGHVLHDPALYSHADSLLMSIDALMRDLKANPKRYFTVRVF